jgi:hypothetical protein
LADNQRLSAKFLGASGPGGESHNVSAHSNYPSLEVSRGLRNNPEPLALIQPFLQAGCGVADETSAEMT